VKKVLLLTVVAALFLAAGAMPSPVPAEPQIALLDAHNTRVFMGKHYPECGTTNKPYYLGADEYQRYFRGWQWVLDKEGLPYRIIVDDDVTAAGLADFNLLILSNDASLSDAQAKAIQKWVIGGGRLLATFGSGYKSLASDPRQDDGLKVQEGGTFGLHQLWHDPVGKIFSTLWIDSGVDVNITRYEGPTEDLKGKLINNVLGYGAEANLLIQRPISHKDVLAFLVIDNPDWKSTTPAIIATKQSKGLVVYFAFAPEYIVYKELEYYHFHPAQLPEDWTALPADWPSCDDTQNWSGRSADLRTLMVGTLNYLLNN